MDVTFRLPTPLQRIENELTRKFNVQLYLKRDDLIHPFVSGNKWRKLKYHLEDAKRQGKDTILTVGGAFSNHITATAAACRELGFKSIGIIRGDELKPTSNTSLKFASEQGMQLHFIDRLSFARVKNDFNALCSLPVSSGWGGAYFVPEGGATELGRKGCAELVDEIEVDFDFISCACGTGTTISGIAQNLKFHQKALGISVINNDDFLLQNPSFKIQNYSFGGYAKANHHLIRFIKEFYKEHQVELDYVYTGKMMFGVFDLIRENYFPPGSVIIAVHTGGVQNASVF